MSASMRLWTSSFQIFQYSSDIADRSSLNSAWAATASPAAAMMNTFFIRPFSFQ